MAGTPRTGGTAPPAAEAARDPKTDAAVALLRETRFVALTGAGMSTDSGIPDYRGPGSVDRRPMTFQEFRSGHLARQRYWARAHLGWARMGRAAPNAGHSALAGLERWGLCRGVVTQNVDGLHEAAGSVRLVALHGRIADVVCLDCGEHTSRQALRDELDRLNPLWGERHRDAPVRPDGDVELDDTASFVVPDCPCGGALKPDVVFFGESVPRTRVERCFAMVDAAEALLVLGSSLTVMSGLRFARHAARQDKPVVIVNRGTTRGDDLATITIHRGTSEFLTDSGWLV